ncbi:unnamed protein product [Leptidea sinapis]|uniref:Uncharacterized protein n=1 Tax=Leptidea sinapis TaxID=189913 RepID=A0A5E4R4E0_9NEOP|nr:unnamed protein product [Leptidea sinapis]
MSVVFVAIVKDEVDKVIEHEITRKLSTDLLQSIEKKFHIGGYGDDEDKASSAKWNSSYTREAARVTELINV